MLVLRLLLVLGLIAVVVSFSVFLLTRDRRYLRFTWQLIKFSVVLLLVFAALLTLGRIILL